MSVVENTIYDDNLREHEKKYKKVMAVLRYKTKVLKNCIKNNEREFDCITHTLGRRYCEIDYIWCLGWRIEKKVYCSKNWITKNHLLMFNDCLNEIKNLEEEN